MNIETTSINHIKENKSTNTNQSKNNDSSVKFSDELKELEKETKTKNKENEKVEDAKKTEAENTKKTKDIEDKNIKDAMKDLKSTVEKLNQTDEKAASNIKNNQILSDNNNVIDKDFNIQDKKDILPQMNPNMNFSGDGQPFSSFMNNEQHSKFNPNSILGTSTKELAEEAAILSTMAENIAIANKAQVLKESQIIISEEGVKKVDILSGIKIETITQYDSIIMNKADVEVFVNLVEGKEINLNNLTSNSIEKNIQISKTLADMLLKSMENNKPVRIDFDNNISVIIKISRDGKITADFLPSSQVAEAYLKENLPLLRQRFDENNIKYDELNQRERRDSNKDNNRKKGRNNE